MQALLGLAALSNLLQDPTGAKGQAKKGQPKKNEVSSQTSSKSSRKVRKSVLQKYTYSDNEDFEGILGNSNRHSSAYLRPTFQITQIMNQNIVLT
jgi:hypothetical protein